VIGICAESFIFKNKCYKTMLQAILKAARSFER